MTTAAVPWTGPPPWAVGASRRPSATPIATPARSLRVPLVAQDEWFWDLVGVDEVEEPARPLNVDSTRAWGLVAAPLAVVVQVALTDALRLAVPGWVLLGELLVACWLLARADADRLRDKGVGAPSPLLALVPPLYLLRRAELTRDPRLPLSWLAAAAVASIAFTAVDAHLSAVPLRSQAVEGTLYEQLFEGRLPLDAQTGIIRCPTFSARWVGQEFRCTGTDAHGTVPLEVSVLDHDGTLSWLPLQAAP